MVSKIWLTLIILIILNMTGFIYVIGFDVIQVAMNPAEYQQTISKLGMDSGSLLLKSQTVITDSLMELETREELSNMERQFLTNQIIGSVAFTFLLVFLVMAGLKFIFRKHGASFMVWFALFVAALIIVGVLQVIASYFIFGTVTYPYSGFLSLLNNIDVFANNFFSTIPEAPIVEI